MAEKHKKSLFIAMVVSIAQLGFLFALVAFILSRLPDNSDVRSYGVVAALVVLSLLYAIYFSYQLRRIRTARFPGIQSSQAIIATGFLFLAIFATVYTIISLDSPDSFTEELTPFSSMYYAITVLSTVGFGDITPVSIPARSVTMLQMALGLVYLGVIIRVFASAAKQRKVGSSDEGGTEHSDPRG